MKKIVAKLCIWILGKIGYENGYSKKNEIVITVNADQALVNIDRVQKAVKKLKFELDAIKIFTV